MAKRAKPQNGGETEQPQKKRGRKPKEQPPKQDFTPEQQDEARERAWGALKAWRSKQASARTEKQKLDKEIETLRSITGFTKKSLLAALFAKEQDPEALEAEIRENNRAFRFMQVKIGTQLGLFDDGETVADKVDADSGTHDHMDTPANIKRARSEGKQAGATNVHITANPYAEGTGCNAAWSEAWRASQANLAEGFRSKGRVNPEDAQPALN